MREGDGLVNICIETIPHGLQSYDTLGNWIFADDGDLSIYVSDLKNWRYQVLIGIHEAIEAILCKHNGVSGASVTAFDVRFESNRPPGNVEEPGDAPDSPYRRQHSIATAFERMLADWLDVNWQEYERACLEVEL